MKRWWRRRSLRVRLMLIGVVGLCVGFLAGGVALVGVLGFVLQRSVDAEATATARQVAELVNVNALPQPVPVAGGQVQVIDASGRVRSASADADPLVPILRPPELAQVRASKHLFIDGERIGVEGPVRVVGVAAGPADDAQTVVVARSMVDVVRGLGLLRTLLLVVFPLIVVVLALVAWRVIGATLRPVEALRRGAEEITGADVGPGATARLPVPVGRDEIQRLAVTLNGMLDRLAAGRERRREFVGDAAHELRSPLTNMRTQLEVAQHLGPTADWPAVADDLLADTKRLSRLVDDLLLLARSDGSPLPSRLEPVELGGLIREVAIRSDRVDVVASDVDGPVWTVGDRDELRRVVANLADNAIRHARHRVCLDAAVNGASAVITVTDDGPGIPAEDRDRVFERFTRLDDSRTLDTGGAGLGLAIVRELVRRHNGTVTLTDAMSDPTPEGPGLRVEVRLPVDTVGSG
jgi:signal transduction histidine kinase